MAESTEYPLPPLAAFCAAMKILGKADANLISMATNRGNPAFAAAEESARDWLLKQTSQGAKETLSANIAFWLDDGQKACLFANLVATYFCDGGEPGREVVSSIEDVLGLHSADARAVVEGMESLFNIKMVERDEDWPPVLASLLALSEADEDFSEAEKDYLGRFNAPAGAMENARKLLEESAAAGVLDDARRLPSRTKRYLTANLTGLMLVDGRWLGTEQELVDQFANKLFISRREMENQMKAAYCLFNFSVFGGDA